MYFDRAGAQSQMAGNFLRCASDQELAGHLAFARSELHSDGTVGVELLEAPHPRCMRVCAVECAARDAAPEHLAGKAAAHPPHDALVLVAAALHQGLEDAFAHAVELVHTGVEQGKALPEQHVRRGAEQGTDLLIAGHDDAVP